MVPPWLQQNLQHFPAAFAALALRVVTHMYVLIATKELKDQKEKLFLGNHHCEHIAK